jgi:DNA-binding NarL/FixJ family response regulator
MEVIRIGIADDHVVFIKGLKACLQPFPQFNVVVESLNGQLLVESLSRTPVDIVLMDIHMPVMDGIAATYYIREHFPAVRVLGLSMSEDEKCITDLIRAGANGYLVKTTDPQEIMEAIVKLYQSDFYFNQWLSVTLVRQYLLKNDLLNGSSHFVTLNYREQEVLKLVCEELSNTEIAKKLYVSKRTVEGYRSKLLEKCGVKNVAGLVLYAVKIGIIAH